MLKRGAGFKEVPINIVGSSSFGRYPKISIEKTYNMYISDNWLVPFAGYQIAIPQSIFTMGGTGRGNHTSNKLNRLICVVGSFIYLVDIFFDQSVEMSFDYNVSIINATSPMATATGPVWITETNQPNQIVISDNVNVYVYDPFNPNGYTFYIADGDGAVPSVTTLLFTPGYVDFHDNYVHCVAYNNTGGYNPPANYTWRLSSVNPTTGKLFFDCTSLAAESASTGQLTTKPDTLQAVIRMPSRGNMILALGKTVAEPWYDQGLKLFPYVRSTAFSVDYGCLNPATIATTDKIAVWLAGNEKAGPIIMYTTGGEPEKITTDGIDFLFSQLKNPSDSQGFIMRQDGHVQYIINFYTDNLSLMYDFNTQKFFHLSDENLNHFKANEVAFFNNQYYFLTNQNGNLYAFDTIYPYYSDANTVDPFTGDQVPIIKEIPRIRTCKSVRSPDQSYRIANDIGFTIESGETPFQQQNGGPIFLVTQDNEVLITQGASIFLVTQDNEMLITQNNNTLISQQSDSADFNLLIAQNNAVVNVLPRVDLSVSYDGGVSFGNDFGYTLPAPGYRKNRLMWWQLGAFNDFTPQFKFWGIGRFVTTDGVLNVRQ